MVWSEESAPPPPLHTGGEMGGGVEVEAIEMASEGEGDELGVVGGGFADPEDGGGGVREDGKGGGHEREEERELGGGERGFGE